MTPSHIQAGLGHDFMREAAFQPQLSRILGPLDSTSGVISDLPWVQCAGLGPSGEMSGYQATLLLPGPDGEVHGGGQ